jgi:hypothetical protein
MKDTTPFGDIQRTVALNREINSPAAWAATEAQVNADRLHETARANVSAWAADNGRQGRKWRQVRHNRIKREVATLAKG